MADASNNDRVRLMRLLRYLGPDRSAVAWGTVFSALKKTFDVLPELLIGVAVDVVVRRQDSFLSQVGIQDPKIQIAALGGMTALIWILESVFEYLYQIQWRTTAQRVQHRMRIEAYNHLQRLEAAWFESKSTGTLAGILTDDVNQLERFLDGGANSLIQIGMSVVLVGGAFFYLSPILALTAMLPIPVILLGAFGFQKKAEPLYATVRDAAGRISGLLANNLSGILTIQASNAEASEGARVERTSMLYVDANRQAIAVSSVFVPLIRLAILAGFLFTLILGGLKTLDGSLGVGSYSALVYLTQRLLWPLTGLAQTVDLFQRAMASADRVLDILDVPAAQGGSGVRPNTEVAISSMRTSPPTLEFKSVVFSYPGRGRLLENLCLEIEAGKTTALVGATGSGKSTVAKLLLRFYQPQGGEILMDGRPLEQIELSESRALMGWVSQDVFLFPGTVEENIRFGSPDASQVDVEQAAQIAEADLFIRSLPEGYATLIGERGQKLSGGQRQRIAIARAVLKNPPILILDEATSALDNETERAIQSSLSRVAKGRTVLTIAHRLSTIVHADRIYVLDYGRVLEVGTHDELLKKQDGQYAKLWDLQTSG